jgi:hypothetical protein
VISDVHQYIRKFQACKNGEFIEFISISSFFLAILAFFYAKESIFKGNFDSFKESAVALLPSSFFYQ